MGKTPTNLTDIAASLRGWIGQLAGELQDAGPLGADVRQRLDGLATAIDAITAAKGKAAIIVTDPAIVVSVKLQRARDLVLGAFNAASQAEQACTAALENARAQITKAFFPSKPGAATDAMAAFQASQLEKILVAAGDGVLTVAVKLLSDALASGDEVTAWLLAGGPLALTYKRLQVNEPLLNQEFAKALQASAKNTSMLTRPLTGPAAGASLLPHLQAGGSGTLNGLMVATRWAIDTEQRAYTEWLQASASIGAMQGGTPASR